MQERFGVDQMPQERVFRFVQWNDQHVSVRYPDYYRLVNEKHSALVEATNQLKPEFVVSVGDMVGGRGRIADLRLFKRLTGNLACPLHPVIGNHETHQTEYNDTEQKSYIGAFGLGKTNYMIEAYGILFVMLDNTGAPMSNNTEVGKRRNNWLREALVSNADKPKIICCHIPLVPLREASVLAKSFGFVSDYAHDQELLDIVNAHSDTVIAVLSGHLHLTGVVEINGIYHIVPSGSASFPCDYAVFDVFEDRIHLRMKPLPEQFQTADTNIHGKPRWEIDYTDKQHPTHDLYIRGNESERDLIIPLSGLKRPRSDWFGSG